MLKTKKLLFITVLVGLAFALSALLFTKPVVAAQVVRHGVVSAVYPDVGAIEISVVDPADGTVRPYGGSGTRFYPSNFKDQKYNIGIDVYFVDNGGTITNNNKISTQPFDTNIGYSSDLFGGYCEAGAAGTVDSPLTCWIRQAYGWATSALFVLSIGALIFSGITWMSSAGDPAKITFAKKVLWGAVVAILVVVLGRVFLVNVLGVEWII